MSPDISPPYVLTKPVADEQEYYALGEDSPFEFLDGRLVMSPSSYRQEDLGGFLIALARIWLEERGGGVVLGSRYPMRLDPRWSPEPDLLVVTDALRDRLLPTRLEGPAAFVVEIAPDGDPRLDEREKRPRYHQARIPEMWWISPQTGTVLVDQLDGDTYRTRRLTDGRLPSVVLPGFWIEVGWLWQDPLPSTMACLRELLD
ncbi:MAG: Uma2 family endonuclease [Pseudonocardia sp.]